MSDLIFPHGDPFEFEDHLVAVDWAEEQVASRLTPERIEKIHRVVDQRTYGVCVVLENIYDRGNSSAVMRSAEAMGVQSICHIEPGERFKVANRVSKGADKWLDQSRFRTTGEALADLKSKGYQLVATSLTAETPIADVNFLQPSAIILGNERDGVSDEMLAAADHVVKIPMLGFVESFNISVAGALALYHILRARAEKHSDLSDEQKRILRAVYYCRSNVELSTALMRGIN